MRKTTIVRLVVPRSSPFLCRFAISAASHCLSVYDKSQALRLTVARIDTNISKSSSSVMCIDYTLQRDPGNRLRARVKRLRAMLHATAGMVVGSGRRFFLS